MTAANTPVDQQGDIRPVVRLAGGGNAGVWVFVSAMLLGGWLVFSMLSDRRAAVTAPRTAALPDSGSATISSPPPLMLPEGRDAYGQSAYDPYPVRLRRAPAFPAPSATASPRTSPAARPQVASSTQAPPVTNPSFSVRPAEPTTSSEAPRTLPEPAAAALEKGDRVRAGRLANPHSTVPQGTVIPAVLETAMDSTRPGAARALVQRNIYGFDGTRILIPRGSRLYGEYEADLGSGQKRAAVRWTRLLRPDGVTVALDSPASDPLGRAGIKGKVDSKFLQRFSGALLQSVLDIGVGLATRQATDGVIVALPGSTQNVQVTDSQSIKPTLTVRQGTSVSVFVSRDLDFSDVDG